MNLKKKLFVLFSSLVVTGTVQAGLIFDDSTLGESILGGRFFVESTGNVQAQFLGSDASHFSTLSLDSPEVWGTAGQFDSSTVIFKKNTQLNTVFDLGDFIAGTELIFRLDVRHTGLSFLSGDASRNKLTDSLAHAEAVTTLLGDGSYLTNVGFEDLKGGGDLDFNDFKFSLTNVVDPLEVPEPSVLFLMVCGMASLLLTRRKLQPIVV
jgi:hypothetical protein